MDGKEIFKEILESPKLKTMLGDLEIDDMQVDFDSQISNKEILIIKSIIEGELRHTSDDALFQIIKKIYGL